MLIYSEMRMAEWALSLKKHEDGVIRAQKSLEYWTQQYDEQKWQIAQREQEVNGL